MKTNSKCTRSYLLMLHAERTATRCGISPVPGFGTENVPKIGPAFLKDIYFRRFFSTSLLCTTRLPGIRSQGILYHIENFLERMHTHRTEIKTNQIRA